MFCWKFDSTFSDKRWADVRRETVLFSGLDYLLALAW